QNGAALAIVIGVDDLPVTERWHVVDGRDVDLVHLNRNHRELDVANIHLGLLVRGDQSIQPENVEGPRAEDASQGTSRIITDIVRRLARLTGNWRHHDRASEHIEVGEEQKRIEVYRHHPIPRSISLIRSRNISYATWGWPIR